MVDYMHQVVKMVNLAQDRPLNEIVYEGLRSAIIKGVIPVGERINEKTYAQHLNISRTPIRNAISRFQGEGIVEYIPNQGVVIKRVTVKNAIEIYQLRIALDTLASIEAMRLMTPQNYHEMQSLLERTEAAEAAKNVEQVIAYFSDFNNMIYQMSQMPILTLLIQRLRDYLARFRDISLYDNRRRRMALDEHWLIYRCLKSKDEEQLSMLIKEHLLYSEQFVLQEVQKEEEA